MKQIFIEEGYINLYSRGRALQPPITKLMTHLDGGPLAELFTFIGNLDIAPFIYAQGSS